MGSLIFLPGDQYRYPPFAMNDWAVYRTDFHGTEFLVKSGLSEVEAEALAAEYIAKGHHQHYWADKQPPEHVDYVALLKGMLSTGSTAALALPVLKSQGATKVEAKDALLAVCNLSEEQCRIELLRCYPQDEPPGG